MNTTEQQLLQIIADMNGTPSGAYNIRANGSLLDRKTTENINIVTKENEPGMDIIIRPNTVGETVHVPVIITDSGINDLVYNNFIIGENCDITIVAGCGIHNCGDEASAHDGIHTFFVGKNAKVKYVEKHYGAKDKSGKNTMNPTTVVNIDENGYMEMETVQIEGIDSTKRVTRASVADGGTLIIHEKILTSGVQYAETDFSVDLNGENSSANVVSRSVAKNDSKQIFRSNINGNNICSGHTECDAIIMDNAKVSAIPEISANHTGASLIHEAAIGKIAGEQLIKLMTLGLTEAQAEQEIINGFLK